MSKLHQLPSDTLFNAAREIECGHHAVTRRLLAGFRPSEGPSARLEALIHAALLARIDDGARQCGNLYASDDCDQDRMIAAFSLLAERTPMIRFGYAVANRAIVNVAIGAEVVHIVDIGIGAGVQWFDLLDRLASLGHACPRVRITGIDVPDAAGEVARRLHELGERLRSHARGRGVVLEFVGVARAIEAIECIESIQPIQERERRPGEVLAINASLALHHVAAEPVGDDPRDTILRRLAGLRPELLTLVEPEADHNHPELSRRLTGARHHYGLVFAILDEVLRDEPEVRAALERGFFGRELTNILGFDGAARVERHEPLACWQRRLRAAGFSPVGGEVMAIEPTLVGHDFSLARREHAVQLRWRGNAVLSFSAWTAQPARRGTPMVLA